ncbi:S-acyl fatty acid synthase thioesterase, medium chain-like isoform X1 [Cervus elaphus]|uniref:S-acyl fatty acid synthase thioesterase, medium chain-like isoform X1 n=1 Tax=Cervus elaphus TaxID=9860 RepID=UPI001CC2DD20|nr:S-acyl fatty acid synthase thioesterase, medium chain-like isoform X1 [Cervus elaphus]XP_043739921.1 S-acyl fatty acid synthase thioesterase, medium chain-like isoform X1 [Cervus elaphus]XP_043739922.1 S-acyl fatty acid synthase thioesterase, medium chain-like isoform X1 [Cervus elaphus]XP_043739923.1 S-acyl fatty acid synthase thioesterase, medium chain-like isoform X1 [Cervus elaphus]XP_043739924.1 S-acyl fatty acid synthase thioesterase, medium chain-like isoform X1 [Cervus elaphus]XP_04
MESRDKAETIRNEKVVNCLYQNRNALFRLVCFPWGGGGSNFFAKWGQDIPNSVEVHAIRLAGRESRLDEPFASDMHQVVDEIACALLPIIQGENFAFFGHSMGSYIAFFTALHLKEKYNLEPEHLFVSSASPPHARLPFLKDDMCVEQIAFLLKEMGGIHDDFVGDEEQSQESFTKVLADLHILKDVICNTHSKTRLSCDITCFSGSEDIPADMEAWKDVTSGNFDSFVLPGHHFYLLEPSNTSFIKKYITKSLEISALAS